LSQNKFCNCTTREWDHITECDSTSTVLQREKSVEKTFWGQYGNFIQVASISKDKYAFDSVTMWPFVNVARNPGFALVSFSQFQKNAPFLWYAKNSDGMVPFSLSWYPKKNNVGSCLKTVTCLWKPLKLFFSTPFLSIHFNLPFFSPFGLWSLFFKQSLPFRVTKV